MKPRLLAKHLRIGYDRRIGWGIMNPELLRVSRRHRIEKASRKLVGPVKDVVEAAAVKLKGRDYDNLSRKQVALFNEESGILYFLLEVAEEGYSRKNDGLFVEGIQFGKKGRPARSLPLMQFPSDPGSVTTSSIFLLRGISPKEMRDVAKGIKSAKIVETHIYHACHILLRKKQKT